MTNLWRDEILHFQDFRENHIVVAGENCVVRNPGMLGMTKEKGAFLHLRKRQEWPD
jgi:hypothetical protein